MNKKIEVNNKILDVVLRKNKYDYTVTIDGDLYYRSPNLLFAVQQFNAI